MWFFNTRRLSYHNKLMAFPCCSVEATLKYMINLSSRIFFNLWHPNLDFEVLRIKVIEPTFLNSIHLIHRYSMLAYCRRSFSAGEYKNRSLTDAPWPTSRINLGETTPSFAWLHDSYSTELFSISTIGSPALSIEDTVALGSVLY